jgi:hypothetical protein
VDFPGCAVEAILKSDEAASFRRAKLDYGRKWDGQRFIQPDIRL